MRAEEPSAGVPARLEGALVGETPRRVHLGPITGAGSSVFRPTAALYELAAERAPGVGVVAPRYTGEARGVGDGTEVARRHR